MTIALASSEISVRYACTSVIATPESSKDTHQDRRALGQARLVVIGRPQRGPLASSKEHAPRGQRLRVEEHVLRGIDGGNAVHESLIGVVTDPLAVAVAHDVGVLVRVEQRFRARIEAPVTDDAVGT